MPPVTFNVAVLPEPLIAVNSTAPLLVKPPATVSVAAPTLPSARTRMVELPLVVNVPSMALAPPSARTSNNPWLLKAVVIVLPSRLTVAEFVRVPEPSSVSVSSVNVPVALTETALLMVEFARIVNVPPEIANAASVVRLLMLTSLVELIVIPEKPPPITTLSAAVGSWSLSQFIVSFQSSVGPPPSQTPARSARVSKSSIGVARSTFRRFGRRRSRCPSVRICVRIVSSQWNNLIMLVLSEILRGCGVTTSTTTEN